MANGLKSYMRDRAARGVADSGLARSVRRTRRDRVPRSWAASFVSFKLCFHQVFFPYTCSSTRAGSLPRELRDANQIRISWTQASGPSTEPRSKYVQASDSVALDVIQTTRTELTPLLVAKVVSRWTRRRSAALGSSQGEPGMGSTSS